MRSFDCLPGAISRGGEYLNGELNIVPVEGVCICAAQFEGGVAILVGRRGADEYVWRLGGVQSDGESG